MKKLTYTKFNKTEPFELICTSDSTVYHSKDHHCYILPHKGVNPELISQIGFIHGVQVAGDPLKELHYTEGVTDEQLLEILIDRSEHFQTILPCEENVIALDHLKAALKAKLDRTAKRQSQSVEGTNISHKS